MKALRLLLCLAVAACADLETKPWFRVDGNPASAEQLDLDKTTCRQEMQRSVQATTQAAGLDRNIVRSDVYRNLHGAARLLGQEQSNDSPRRRPFRAVPCRQPPRAVPRRQRPRAGPLRQPLRAPCRRRSRAASRHRAISNAGRLRTCACGCRSARDAARARLRLCRGGVCRTHTSPGAKKGPPIGGPFIAEFGRFSSAG